MALAVTAFCLYLVAPSLAETFSSWPDLARIEPAWLVAMLALEGSSLATVWILQRICLRQPAFGPVALSQLAGNALAKIAPGGGAAGGALQYRMLTDAGLDPAAVGGGLTSANLLTFATLLALPVLTVPAVAVGLPVERGLVNAALLGAALFLVVAAFGGLLLASDRALELVGRLAQGARNRVLSRRPPLRNLSARLVRERNMALRVIGRHKREALLSAVLRWLLDYSALLLALAAVGAEPRPSLVLLAFTASQLLATVPLTPGGLGFVEAGLTGLLVLAGVSAGDAAVATLAYRLVSYWLPLPAGAVGRARPSAVAPAGSSPLTRRTSGGRRPRGSFSQTPSPARRVSNSASVTTPRRRSSVSSPSVSAGSAGGFLWAWDGAGGKAARIVCSAQRPPWRSANHALRSSVRPVMATRRIIWLRRAIAATVPHDAPGHGSRSHRPPDHFAVTNAGDFVVHRSRVGGYCAGDAGERHPQAALGDT